MKLYFASPTSTVKDLLSYGAKNILIAYVYFSKTATSYLKNNFKKDTSLIIDSGAFTVWTKNKRIDIDEYLSFCNYIKKELGFLDNLYFVNLDVIPGEYGKKPNNSQIEISAKASYQNFTYLLSKGLKTIPVFHQHEEIKWLEKYINETDYIGISPANDLTTKKRMEWMDQVYYLLKGKIKTHSFGGIAEDILKRYPLYSGDSSSWNGYCRWYRTRHIKYDKIATGKNDQKQIAKQQIKIYQEIEANITKLWKYRGINYD